MEEKNLQVVGDATKARFISAIVDNLIAILLTIITVSLVPEGFSTLRGVLLITVYLGYYFILEAVWSRTLGNIFKD